MKHLKTILFLLALMGSIGAWAETINLGNSSSFKNNTNTTFYKNGEVQSAGVWCDKATQGYVILTGSLSSYDGKIEVLKNGTPSLTISVPSVMTITGYSIGLKINQQNGTNTCTANNGGSDITLNGSSATTVSASGLSTNSVTINFTGTGDNNGECRLEFSDFTIEVSGTFVSSSSQLSNTKAYVVMTTRGQWTLNSDNTLLSSTHKTTTTEGDTEYDGADTSAEAKEFAIYKQGDYYYLYSLKAKKFVVFSNSNQGAPLYNYATIPYTVSTSNYSPYPLRVATYDSRYYANNNGGGAIAINGWNAQDGGNRLAIAEARDLTSEEISAINNALESSMVNKHKAFTVTANRGQWCANSGGTSLATTTTNANYATDYEKFALMFLNNKYYLYNLGTKKFIKGDGSLNADGGDEISVRYSGDTSRPYMFFFPNGNASYTNAVYFNMQNGGGSYAMNEYSSPDDGNKQSITQTDAVYIGEMLAKFESVNDVPTGSRYHITTTIGGTKYYVTATGKLSESITDDDGTIFAISKTDGGDFGSGIRINSSLGRFTNPTLNGDYANLTQNFYAYSTSGDRTGYERQVFFMNDEGKYAIRSCNVASGNSSWADAARTFWTYNVAEATPCYSYAPAYVWELEEAGAAIDFTFNFKFGGTKVHEATVSMEDGVPSVIPSSLNRDFCTYSCTPVTVSSSTTSVDVNTTWTGPFEISADYASAHWYDMAVRGNWYVTSDRADGDGALETVLANAMGLAEDAYQWAFVGDPWHVKLFNKDKGSSLVYAWTSTDNKSIPDFVDASSTNYWWIRQSTASGDAYANAFLLTIPDYGYQVNQFGGDGGPLKIWSVGGTGDVGSAFTVFDVPDDFHEFAAAEIQSYVTARGYFALKDAVKADIDWQDSYATECSFATYKAMKEKLLTYMDNINSYNLPETGYYRFMNKASQKYMVLEGTEVYANKDTNTGASTIVYLEKDKDNDGKYIIKMQGRYLQPTSSDSQLVPLSTESAYFTVDVPEAGYGEFSNEGAAFSYLHYKDNGKVVGWNANAEASKWVIEDAENFDLTIGSTGYSTLWVPFPVTIPDGVEAYTGTINNTGWLHLNAIEDVIPANTAVVLKGSAATYNFDIADDVDAISGNVLLGSNGNVTGDGSSIYALSKPTDKEIGFYLVGDGVRVPANKAYLNIPSAGVRGFKFVFDDETSIDRPTPNPSRNGGEVYDLSGRKINAQLSPVNSQLKKGVYIVNGRKVLF